VVAINKGTTYNPIRILLVEDSNFSLRDALGEEILPEFEVTHVTLLGEALHRLEERAFDVLLMDIDLPDSVGLDGVAMVKSLYPQLPILVLTDMEDESAGVRAIHKGAQDYLLKGNLKSHSLERIILYTIERQRSEQAESDMQRTLQSTLDALPAQIAVLDERGNVIFVNKAWADFSLTNSGFEDAFALREGDNYLAACDKVSTLGVPAAASMARCIRELIIGQMQHFQTEYSYRGTYGEHWFSLDITRFSTEAPLRIVLSRSDITERKRAELAHSYFTAIAQSSEDAIVGASPDSTIISWNRGAEQLYGYRAEEVIGKPFTILVPPDKVTEFQQHRQTLIKNGHSTLAETIRVRKDGTRVEVSVRVSPVFDSSNNIIGVCAIARDISERRAVERLQARMASMVESSDDAIISSDLNGIITTWNRAAEELYGYTADEIIGQSTTVLVPVERAAEKTAVLQKLARGEKVRNAESEHIRKNGQRFYVSVTVSPLWGADGNVGGISIIARDITERKRAESALRLSEERFQRVSRATNDTIWDWDVSTNVLWWSHSFESFFGFHPSDIEPTIDWWTGRIHPDDVDRVTESLHSVLQADGEVWSEEYRFRKADNSYADIFDRGYVFRDETGKAVRMTGSMLDISARKRSEEELLRTKDELEKRVAERTADLQTAYEDLYAELKERNRVEVALRDSEQKFRSVIQSAHDAIVLADSTDIIRDWNTGAERLFGYRHDEIIGKPVTLLMPQRYRASHQQGISRVSSGGMPKILDQTIEFEGLRRDGREFPLELSLTSWTVGSETFYAAFMRDITQRKQAEANLARSLSLLRATLESTADGIMVQNGHGKIENYNQRFLEMWDIPQDMVDLDDSERLLEFALGQVKNRDIFERRFWELHYDHESESHDVVEFEDGRVFERYSIPQRVEGRSIGRVWSFRDVTQRIAAEQELRQRARQQEAVAELGQRALTGTDLDLLMDGTPRLVAATLDVEVSSVLEILPGGEEMLCRAGIGWRDGIVGHYKAPATMDTMAGYALHTGLPVILEDTNTEARFRVSEAIKEHRILSGMAVIIQTESEPFGVLSAYTTQQRAFTQDDIHFLHAVANVLASAIERQRSEDALRSARDEAERANRAKSGFLSRMSHELRTPLNAILGFGQILEIQKLTPQQHESVGHILKGGQHLLGLINEVLDISKVEEGHLALSIEPVNLWEVVHETVELVRPIAVSHHINLAEALPEFGHLYVMADRQRLKQVLLNLLSNAVKYNRDGGEVTVMCGTVAENRLRLEVHDTGIGITSDDREKLFTPFERLNAVKTGIEGTGLGLALSKRLIEAMNGTLDVASSTSAGSVFYVELPLTESPVEYAQRAEESLRSQRHSPGTEDAFILLVIEDNVSNLRLIEAILENRPAVELQGAMQGTMGLELAQQHQPDLILLDLNLPDISGDEVLKRLQQKSETREIPVVVCSADATSAQIKRLLAAGAKQYLTKPINVVEFLGVLDEAIKSKRRNRKEG
jgi:PAS domain S-box-containing protein